MIFIDLSSLVKAGIIESSKDKTMQEPKISYRLEQICQYVGDDCHVEYAIFYNEDNEMLWLFREDQAAEAFELWWKILTDEERAAWYEYKDWLLDEEEYQYQRSQEQLAGY